MVKQQVSASVIHFKLELNGFLTRVNEFSVLLAKSWPFDTLKDASLVFSFVLLLVKTKRKNHTFLARGTNLLFLQKEKSQV